MFRALVPVMLVVASVVQCTQSAQADPLRFRYYPDQLETPAARHRLLTRLEHRVESYCRADTPGAAAHKLQVRCRHELLEQLIAQMNDGRLTALHRYRQGVTVAKK